MSLLLTNLGCLGVFLGVIGIALLGFWLAFGRKKKAEDKAIGLLEQMAHFKATNSVDAMQRRIR